MLVRIKNVIGFTCSHYFGHALTKIGLNYWKDPAIANLAYAYKEVTERKIIQAVRWFQNRFNLRDWTIDLYFGNLKPTWVPILMEESPGVANPEINFLVAKIWICPKNCEDANVHPLQILFHEMLHVIFELMSPNYEEPNNHPVINRMEGPLTKLYFIEKNLKIPTIRVIGEM